MLFDASIKFGVVMRMFMYGRIKKNIWTQGEVNRL